jgi:DNA-binding MarR family transcriptional regulator
MAKVRNNIPFLMNQIVSRVHAESTEEFRELGFNLQSARVLIVALQHPGSTVGKLAEITTLDLSTLSHMLARMNRQKLLERRRDERDTRRVTVHLTAEGERLALGCKRASDDRERRMLKDVSAAEAETLRAILGKVFETVRSENWSRDGAPRRASRAS